MNVTQIISLVSTIEGLAVNTNPNYFQGEIKRGINILRKESKKLARYLEKNFDEKGIETIDYLVEIYQEALDSATEEISNELKKAEFYGETTKAENKESRNNDGSDVLEHDTELFASEEQMVEANSGS